MKKNIVAVIFLAITLAVLPGVASSAMWVGGQIGGNFPADVDLNVKAFGVTGSQAARIENSVMGGVTVGYDFINQGFLGYAWPDWMKYFSFATDFTYNRYDIRGPNSGSWVPGPGARLEGFNATLSFLFIGKVGFFPDSEVPFGRLQPYVGVGPGILFSGLNLTKVGLQDRSSADICLVTEAGLRFMALKNVSLDAAFRYRYAAPGYGYHVAGVPAAKVDVDFDAHQFSFLFRASLHF